MVSFLSTQGCYRVIDIHVYKHDGAYIIQTKRGVELIKKYMILIFLN